MSTNDSNDSLVWTEKYRPTSLDKMVFNDKEIENIFKKYIESKNIPHLLFYGPPGVGKTSLILACAKELFPGDKYKERVMFLNASNERGIDVVRNKILLKAKTYVSPKSPCFKLIILDEADAMTKDAQYALRRLMEIYSDSTRFCFICNYKNKIINAIESRCTSIEFNQMNNNSSIQHLMKIAKKENLEISEDQLKIISSSTNGDLRRSISILQNLKYFCKNDSSNKKTFSDENFCFVCNIVPSYFIEKVIKVCFNDSKVSDLQILAKELYKNAYSSESIINSLTKRLFDKDFDMKNVNEKKYSKVNDEIRAHLITELFNIQSSIKVGCNENICLLALFNSLNKIYMNKIK